MHRSLGTNSQSLPESTSPGDGEAGGMAMCSVDPT